MIKAGFSQGNQLLKPDKFRKLLFQGIPSVSASIFAWKRRDKSASESVRSGCWPAVIQAGERPRSWATCFDAFKIISFAHQAAFPPRDASFGYSGRSRLECRAFGAGASLVVKAACGMTRGGKRDLYNVAGSSPLAEGTPSRETA